MFHYMHNLNYKTNDYANIKLISYKIYQGQILQVNNKLIITLQGKVKGS